MKRAELHRLVSERLEPLETCEGIDLPSAYSPLGYWKRTNVCRVGRWIFEWEAVDFSHSEDASAKLLESMPLGGVTSGRIDGMKFWSAIADCGGPASNGLIHPDRKTAVLLAAKKMLGIEGELED